jgi:hypothetical protein
VQGARDARQITARSQFSLLRGECSTGEPYAARAIRNRQRRLLHRLLGDETAPTLMGLRGSPRLVLQQRRSHEPRSSTCQLGARLHVEFTQRQRHMEFDGAHGDTQPRRDFLVRTVAHHRVQHFSLPGAQRRGASDRGPPWPNVRNDLRGQMNTFQYQRYQSN